MLPKVFVLDLNGLIQVKEEGWTGLSKGWQGCSEGNPSEQPGQPEKTRQSQLFYLDLHSI